MLVVKVELHHARTGEVRELGRTVIWNDDTGSREVGHYHVAVCKPDSNNPQDYTCPERRGRVLNHDRAASVWSLVLKALQSALSAKPEGGP